MRRPVGVLIAAVVLGLMTCFGFLGVALSLFGMLFIHNPAIPSPREVQLVVAGLNVIFLFVLVFLAWTVVDLIRMRSWARYSMIVIGVLMAAFFGMMAAVMLVAAKYEPRLAAPEPLPPHLNILFAVVAAFYAGLALIGVWWVVYFNLKGVRLAFPGNGAALAGGAPLTVARDLGFWRGVVIAMACLTLLGSVILLAMGGMRVPFFLLGVSLRGNIAMAFGFGLAAVQIFVGVGLLLRAKAAYWLAVALQIFGVLQMGLMLFPSYAAKAFSVANEFNQRLSFPSVNSPSMMVQPFIYLVSLFGVGVCLFFLYALFRCRRWYSPQPALSAGAL